MKSARIGGFERIIEQYPNADVWGDALYELGVLRLADGQTAAAAATLSQLTRELPAHPRAFDALVALVGAYEKQESLSLARIALRRLRDEFGDRKIGDLLVRDWVKAKLRDEPYTGVAGDPMPLVAPPMTEVWEGAGSQMPGDYVALFRARGLAPKGTADRLYVSAIGPKKLIARNVNDGGIAWSSNLDDVCHDLAFAGSTLTVRCASTSIMGLDPDTGATRWRFRPRGAASVVHLTASASFVVAVVDTRRSIADVRSRSMRQFELVAIDPATGDALWTERFNCSYMSNRPLLASGAVVVRASSPSIVRIHDILTGELCGAEIAIAGGYVPPVLVGDDLVLTVHSQERVRAYSLQTGDLAWEGASHPGINERGLAADGAVGVIAPGDRNTHKLYAFDPSDGRPLWEAALPEEMSLADVQVLPDMVVATVRRLGMRGAPETQILAFDSQSGKSRWSEPARIDRDRKFAGTEPATLVTAEYVYVLSCGTDTGARIPYTIVYAISRANGSVEIVDQRPPEQMKIARNLVAFQGGIAYVTDPFTIRILAGSKE